MCNNNTLEVIVEIASGSRLRARSVHRIRSKPKCFDPDTRLIWQAITPPRSGLSKPQEGVMTTVAKKKRVYTGLPRKTYWHLYSLQNLQVEKLAKVVNKVLTKDYVLIK